MRIRDLILIAGGGAMLLLIAVFAVRLAQHAPTVRAELGRVKMMHLEPETRRRLAELEHDVLVTYYVSGREHMPSHLRRIEREVVDLLSAMKRASNGRFDYQIVDPESEPDFVRHAAHQRVSPFRVRSVARDSYTERTVWSTLHIAYGSHQPAVINGLSPAHLPRLQAMIIGQLQQKDEPRGPVFALAAPGGYRHLESALAQRGRVVRIDLERGAAIPEDADLLLWMDPGPSIDPAAMRRVWRFMERGRSLIVAGSRHESEMLDPGPPMTFELRPTGYDAETLLSSFGLRPIDGLILDESSQSIAGDPVPMPARFLIRCIPPNQDFRGMHDLPNGHFLFETPTPLALDGDGLAQRGLSPAVLATTSDRTTVQDMDYGEHRLDSAAVHGGERAPKLPLMLWLRPHEPWQGSAVVSASSTPFNDDWLNSRNFAHRPLLTVLLDTLASDERLVIHRAGIEPPPPLPQMAASERAFWRAVCILLFPAVLGVIAWRRGAVRTDAAASVRAARDGAHHRAAGLPLRITAGLAIVLIGVSLAGALGPRADLTEGRLNELAPPTRTIAQEARGELAVQAEMLFSRPENLPPEMRPMLRRLRDMLRELRAAGAEINVTWTAPEQLDAEDRAELEAEGVRPIRMTTRDEEVTTVRTAWSTLRLTAGGRTELLHFPDRVSFESLEFRLAFALWRLRTGHRPHIAFAADVPRLSAAEVYHDFQERNLLAPTGTDVYSMARETLRKLDFEVTHVNPRSPDIPEEVDAVVWMQPRRDILPMLDRTVGKLHEGIPVMIAAQHFNIQSRQFRGAGFEMVYWPQPQVADIDQHYLPDLGVRLVREVLFDDLKAPLELQSQIRTGEQVDYDRQASALPFILRASAANFARDHLMTRGLGDQVLPFPASIALDDGLLAERGLSATPLLTTSERSWSFNWTGGYLPRSPDDLLAGPLPDDEGEAHYLGRLPLAVLLEGRFPMPAEPLTRRRIDQHGGVELTDEPGEPTRLVLVGCSEMFKNDRLLEEEFRADHLLVNIVAALALDEDLARVATHRRAPRGFDYIDPEERLRWRAIVVSAGPAALVLFGLLWFLGRSRRSPMAARLSDRSATAGEPARET